MSNRELMPGDTVKLTKFPPNRGMMDWDRILRLEQTGIINKLHYDDKRGPLYAVHFFSRNRQEGWELWLAREHFTPTYK